MSGAARDTATAGGRLLRFHDRAALAAWRESLPREASVGLLPTMGGLHEGHAALIHRAASECDHVVVSVFVNPMQFNQQQDFARYPRDLDADCECVARSGGTAVYAPSPEDVYPEGFDTKVVAGEGGRLYEGEFRPGHFDGVLTVVAKLIVRTRPQRTYFGDKDAQQFFLVEKMRADLDLPGVIVRCETVREADGLACSSRNRLLDEAERRRATVLYRALNSAREAFLAGERDPRALEAAMTAVYAAAGETPEYAAVVDDRTFLPAAAATPGPWRAVTAASIGSTRLIDNLLLGRAG